MVYDLTGTWTGKNGNIHLLAEHSAWPRDMMALFAFRLDNAPHIAAAFNEDASQYAMASLCQVLRELVDDGGIITREQDDLVTALIWKTELLGQASPEVSCARFTQDFKLVMAGHSIPWGEQALHASVTGVWSFFHPEQFGHKASASCRGLLAALSRDRFDGAPVGADQGWALSYRSDMEMAARLFSDMEEDRLLLAWQPIQNGVDGGKILYHECLLRDVPEDPGASPAAAIAALERLGLVGALDHHVVSRVVEELACEPNACLGVNISAQSARFEGWWSEIEDRLRDRPDIAPRLVIEITETAQFPNIGQAVAFAGRMRKLGVRIALDDFGVGHASIRNLLALQPDIVKVDRFFLHRAIESDRGRATLQHLVGLAGNMASTIVVEGVETEAEDSLAVQAGALWRQGYHLGRPSVIRPWPQPVSPALDLPLLAGPERRRA